MAEKFTRPRIAAMVCPAGRDEVLFWDEDMPGFGVRCWATGRRVWVTQYRTAEGRQRRQTIGDLRHMSLEVARAKAREVLAQVQLGADPQAAKRKLRQGDRVIDLVDAYLMHAKSQRKARTFVEIERSLRRTAAPLHHHKISTVGRGEIASLLDKVKSSSGPTAANRVRAYLSAMWNWGVVQGRVEGANPVAITGRPASEKSRERVLTDDELALIWRATADDSAYSRVVRLLLLTAQRRDEVGGSCWREWTLEGATWTLPPERTKNGLPHEVPTGSLILEQLPEKRKKNGNLFGPDSRGFSAWSASKARLDARMLKLMRADFTKLHGREPGENEVLVSPWRLHDLRRTFATWANESGIEPHIVEAVLNHVSGAARRGVAGIYNRAAYRTQKIAALAAWELHIRQLAGLEVMASNVVPMRA